jgi:hypothetical protein
LTAELYKVNLNGNKTLFKAADMYAGENFSPDGNYLMISTIQKPFSYIVPLSRFKKQLFMTKTVRKLRSLTKWLLNEIIPKVLWRRVLVKEI